MPSPRDLAPRILGSRSCTTARLREHGLSKKRLRRMVDDGALVRVRRGRYVAADTHPALVDAARLGARLGCVSLLSVLGVFVRDAATLHVHIDRGASRLPPRGERVVAHWREADADGEDPLTIDVVSALVQAVLCQSPRDAVATLDSAWHHGLVDEGGIGEVFGRLPRRHQPLRRLVDPRSEAGTETLMRLLLRTLGHEVRVQVEIAGVGRVDLLVDGWLIVECDSREFHTDWATRRKDLRRDLAAAQLGYTTVRPLAEDILFAYDQLVGAMRDVLSHPRPAPARGGPNSSASGRSRH